MPVPAPVTSTTRSMAAAAYAGPGRPPNGDIRRSEEQVAVGRQLDRAADLLAAGAQLGDHRRVGGRGPGPAAVVEQAGGVAFSGAPVTAVRTTHDSTVAAPSCDSHRPRGTEGVDLALHFGPPEPHARRRPAASVE